MKILLLMQKDQQSSKLQCYLRKEHVESDVAPFDQNSDEELFLDIYDAVVIDGDCCNGHEAIVYLRKNDSLIPVVILCSHLQPEDHIRYLNNGIDYRFEKPYEWKELLCCLRALVRRKMTSSAIHPVHGNIELREGVIRNVESGEQESLSLKEQQLMELFFKNSKQILNKELLIERTWGFDSKAEYNHLEVYISFLRKKLQRVNASIQILTARGIGYSLSLRTDVQQTEVDNE